jgi:hypothetical protein
VKGKRRKKNNNKGQRVKEKKKKEQAWAELCQAQVKLSLAKPAISS